MTVKELMESVGLDATGRALFYIKDRLEEMNMSAETHIKTNRIGIVEGKRFYDIPKDMIKLSDIRCKNNLNSKDEYRGIPRLIGEPWVEDTDQEM